MAGTTMTPAGHLLHAFQSEGWTCSFGHFQLL